MSAEYRLMSDVVSGDGPQSHSSREFASRAAKRTPPAGLHVETHGAKESPKRKQRAWWLDWLRILTIYLVLIYHTEQALDWIGVWCGPQKTQDVNFRCVALQIGMPLFFNISGRAQALASLQDLWTTVKARVKRLLVPFAICYIILIPPWLYISEKDIMTPCVGIKADWDAIANETCGPLYNTVWVPNPEVPQNFFVYEFEYWTGSQFQFNPAWLWFLPALFLISVFNMPLFLFGERHEYRYLAIACVLFLMHAYLTTAILRYNWMFSFFAALAPLFTVVLTLYVPLPPPGGEPSTKNQRWMAIRALTAVHILSSVGMVHSFSYAEIDGLLKVLPGFLMYPLFYSHGYFVERYWTEGGGSMRYHPHSVSEDEDAGSTDEELALPDAARATTKTDDTESPSKQWNLDMRFALGMLNLGLVCLAFIIIFLGSPIGRWEFDSWPVYSRSFLGGRTIFPSAYVLSTWVWLNLVQACFQAFFNDEIHPWLHRHASASTIVVYIFHWLFLKVYVWYVLRDYGVPAMGDWGKAFCAISSFVFIVACSWTVYALFSRCPAIGQLFGIA